MSASRIILACLSSLCKKLSKLVKIWQSSNKSNLHSFLRHGVLRFLFVWRWLVTLTGDLDVWPWLVSLMCELGPDILNMYLHIKWSFWVKAFKSQSTNRTDMCDRIHYQSRLWVATGIRVNYRYRLVALYLAVHCNIGSKRVCWPLGSDVEPWSKVVRRSPKLVVSWAYSGQTVHSLPKFTHERHVLGISTIPRNDSLARNCAVWALAL